MPTVLTGLRSARTRHRNDARWQTGEALLVVDGKREALRRVEHVLCKSRGELRQFDLQGRYPGLDGVLQVDAAEAEIAQRMFHPLTAGLIECREPGTAADVLIGRTQSGVLFEFGSER